MNILKRLPPSLPLNRLLAVTMFVGTSVSTTGQNPVYTLRTKPESARVVILATSTSVYQGFAGHQEVYLSEVSDQPWSSHDGKIG